MRRTMIISAGPLVALALALFGCGTGTPATTEPASQQGQQGEEEREEGEDGPLPGADDLPPPVVVSADDTERDLEAWATCWESTCIDGAPPEQPQDLGVVDGPVTVAFPVDGWSFNATQVDVINQAEEWTVCGRHQLPATVEATGERSWELATRGPAAEYRVDLFGRGPGGDLTVSFTLTTERDRAWPRPRAIAGGSYLDNAENPSFSFGLPVSHLASTPREATADVTVIDDGQRHTVELTPIEDCHPEGEVVFETETAADEIIPELGEPPYERLRFQLDLDGTRHVARADWPLEDPSDETVLEFTPALPGH